MSDPLVSVVIATYNTGRYLPEALDSALAQTHRAIEIVVVDDGSTDDTPARLAPYRARIRCLRQAHGGLAAARNAGLRLARGDYIALLDADDVWRPDALAVQLAVARRHPDSGLVAGDAVEFDGDAVLQPRLLGDDLGRALDAAPDGEVTGWFHEAFIRRSIINCPAQTLIPRRVIERLGWFADSDAQDYDYYLRIAQQFPVTFHREVLARWRYRPDSLSGPHERRAFAWCLQTLPVLRAHAERCGPEHRRLVEERTARLVRDTASQAYRHGGGPDRRHAIRVLLQLLGARPWPPVALPYLAALLAPAPVRRLIERGRREMGRAGWNSARG